MFFFFFNATATTEIYTDGHTLSLHDALPISGRKGTVRTPRLSLSGCGKPVPDDTWIARQSKQDDLRTAPRADAPARADAAARRRYTRHPGRHPRHRSEEHTSELQSLMRISYAVFCLKKKTHQRDPTLH